MVDLYVDLKQIATSLDKHQLLQIIGAWYLSNEYGVEDFMNDDLEDIDQYIGGTGDLLESIGEVINNIDDEENCDDYEEDNYDSENEDYDDEGYDDDEEDDTQRLIEANRRKNEAYLGL